MKKRIKNYKRLCTLLIVSLLIGSAPQINVYGASSLKLYNYTTKTTSTYTDKQISYIYNGNKISMDGTPGILSSNGVSLGSYTHIFQKALGLTCSINKTTKKITIANASTKIVMTVGSKTAYVNGKKVTMNAAPVTYKYVSAKKSLTLVPTRFVAETLGYTYKWDSSASLITITKPLNLFYDNKTVSYTGTMGNVTVDDKAVNVKTLPGILISNTVMLQAWKVFNQSMGVMYKYNLTTGELTFTKGDITVGMKLNSTTATINGESTDCGTAPRMVKDLETEKEMVLVPGSFLAKALGYSYSWDSATRTSVIKTTENVGVKSGITIDNSSSILADAKEYFSWINQSEYEEELALAKQTYENNLEEQSIETDYQGVSYIMNVYQDNSVSNVAYETLVVSTNTPFYSVQANKSDDIITFNFKDTICSDRYYSLGSQLVTNIETSYDESSLTSSVSLKLNSTDSAYDMSMAEDGNSLIIRIYPNYITETTGGINTNGLEYVSITGIKELKPELTEDDYYVYVTLPNVANTIGDMQYTSEETNCINFTLLETPSTTSSHFIIQKPYVGAEYSTLTEGETFHVYFESKRVNVDTNINSGLIIPLPDGVDYSSITDSDQYYNKKIVLSMDGNYVDFYKENPITTSYDTVSAISVQYSNGKTNITIKTTRIQGYELSFSDNYLNVNVANPSEIYSKIVVLDAGHGGGDPGTLKGKVYEKDIVFKVLNQYAKTYFDSSDIKVYYSRVDDTRIDLYERAAFSAEVEADLFVSLHVNSSTSTTARGTSVYYCSSNSAVTESGLNSQKLATMLVNNLSSTLGTKNLGVIKGNFVVIRENTVPAVLIELAFLSNPSDYKLLTDTSVQKKSAKTIYDTIVSVFDTYPTGR